MDMHSLNIAFGVPPDSKLHVVSVIQPNITCLLKIRLAYQEVLTILPLDIAIAFLRIETCNPSSHPDSPPFRRDKAIFPFSSHALILFAASIYVKLL
jgi:hypothetical protein